MWSLGVVTFELMALQLPFQANSLPALVNKIISSPPNWQNTPRHFSKSLIDLTSNMLNKKPLSRPTLNQIVSTDFLRAHISKLLSYTLNNKNGGVQETDDNEKGTKSNLSQDHNIETDFSPSSCPKGVDEAELNLLYLQQRKKEHEFKEDHLREEATRAQDALQKRERERESSVAFEEMIRKKREDISAGSREALLKLPASQYEERSLVARHEARKHSHSSSEESNLQNQFEPPAYSDIERDSAKESHANYARDQFFANRRAAAAVKARVEADERVNRFAEEQIGRGVRSGAEWDHIDAAGK